MRLWRLAIPRFASSLDGEGARLFGGRWNSAGRPAVYASRYASTALLETLVHADPEDLPDDLRLVELSVPDDATRQVVSVELFPEGWRDRLDDPWFKETGDAWLANGSALLLRVPSVIVPVDENVLVNPHHSDAPTVRIVTDAPFPLDARFRR